MTEREAIVAWLRRNAHLLFAIFLCVVASALFHTGYEAVCGAWLSFWIIWLSIDLDKRGDHMREALEALTAEVAAYGRSLELKQALIEELKDDNDMLRKVIARYQNVCGVLTQSDRDYLAAALEKQP